MDKIFEILNDEQQLAVTSNLKYLLINAGPGTGKTTTIAAKMLYLMYKDGVSTVRILGISFSRAAKAHLLNKLDELTDILGFGGKPVILTFHSLAHRIIKYGIHFGESRYRQGFKIIDTVEFQQLDPSLSKGLCKEYSNWEIANRALSTAYNLIRQGNSLEEKPLSHWKDIPLDKTYNINTMDHGRILIKSNELKTFWQRVSKIEKLKNVTDYQGMITEAIQLLKLKANTYRYVSSSFDYIFIDEFQDTSLAQGELLLAFLNDNHHVTVVGDKNQTIYTFNGSDSNNMENFIEYFSQKDPDHSGQIHLRKNYRSTEEIIKLSNDFINGNIIESATKKEGVIPTVVETHSISLAGVYIAETINSLLLNEGYSPSDICILYRKNSEYSPQRDQVIKHLTDLNIPFSNKERPAKSTTNSLFEQILMLRDTHEDEPLQEVLLLLQRQGENIELIDFVKEAMNQGAYYTDDLTDYLAEIDEAPADDRSDAVTIKTVHNSKGLEYPVVFVLYLGDREFPHSSQPDIKEEKRLLYVAITRAAERLYILGKKGIEFESFLDLCLQSNVQHVKYNSLIEEETAEEFNEKDKNIIDQTTKEMEERQKKGQEELRRLMELF